MKISATSKELLALLPKGRFKSKKPIANNEILVTGGAGFLGIHLLKVLVESKKYGRIWSIVRDASKIKRQAEYYHLGTEWLNQVELVKGDLLNLPESEFPEVEFVIHSAAQIHCIKTLKQLWKNNVEVTQKVAEIYKKNKVFFISTLSVFVSSNLTGIHKPETLKVSDDYLLYGGYAQSKFIGEKIMERYGQSIIRLGLITGSSSAGVFPEDFFVNFVRVNKELGIYPENYEEAWVDMTPVDYCAKGIVDSLDSGEKIVHIANEGGVPLSDFVKWLELKKTSKVEWLEAIKEKNSLEQFLLEFAFFKKEALESNFDYFNLDLFQTTGHSYCIEKKFDAKNDFLLKLYIRRITGNTANMV